jgi:predicted ATP-grasp superfamily ATP-dependent carboligase
VKAPRLLLAGASVRALARSALAGSGASLRFAGGILALDYFGDDDLAGDSRVQAIAIGRDLGLPRTTAGLGRAALRLAAAGTTWGGLAWTGGLENRPGLLRRLGRAAPLLGNAPAAVAAVRNTGLLFAALDDARLPHPESPRLDTAPRDGRRWLFKRRRSAGGHGVRPAAPGERRCPEEDLQERLDGAPGSVAFVADGREARLLGASEQLAGVTAGAAVHPFRYAGNIAGPIEALLSCSDRAMLERAADLLAARFGLRGLNGIDYILTRDGPAILEVNPRFTASMEILEAIAGVSFFDLHLEALEGSLPRSGPGRRATRPGAPVSEADPPWSGKAILYADEAVEAPAPATLEALGVRDRPRRGERFEAGQPLCTLVVAASDREACRAALRAREREVRPCFRPLGSPEEPRDRVIGLDVPRLRGT